MERFLCYFFFHSPHFDFIWSASAHLTVIQNMFTRCPPIDNEHQWCGSKRGFDLRETRHHCRLPIHKLWDHNAVCRKQEILLIKKGKVKREEEHCSSSRGRWSLVFNQSFEKCCQWGGGGGHCSRSCTCYIVAQAVGSKSIFQRVLLGGTELLL